MTRATLAAADFLPSALARTAWASAHASLIVLLLLGLYSTLRWRMSARWRYALWGLVVLRLLLPMVPGSRFSPLNLLAAAQTFLTPAPAASAPPPLHAQLLAQTFAASGPSYLVTPAGNPTITVEPASAADLADVRGEAVGMPEFQDVVTPAPTKSTPPVSQAAAAGAGAAGRDASAVGGAPRWAFWLGVAWLSGMLVLLGRTLIASARLSLALRRMPIALDEPLRKLVEQCCRRVGIRRPPPVRLAGAGFGPAAVGLFHPSIVLPDNICQQLTRQELSLVLLHELVHLRRRDVAVNWLLAILQAVHWFNPIIWLAFLRARADRELACDEAVLRLADVPDRPAYGATLLKLIEILSRGAPSSPLGVGVLDLQSKAQLRRRIAMIARFDRSRRHWSVAGVALSALVGAIALTGPVRGQSQAAQGGSPTPDARPNPGGSPTESAEQKDSNAPTPEKTEAKPSDPTPTLRPGGAEGIGMAGSYGFGNRGGGGGAPGGGFGGYGGMYGMMGGGVGRGSYGGPFSGMPAQVAQPSVTTRVESAESLGACARTAQRLEQEIPRQNFQDNGIREVFAAFRDTTDIDVFVDWKSLEGVVNPDAAISLQLSSTSAEHALGLILRAAGGDQIGYAIDRGVIFVSRRDVINEMLVTRVYRHLDAQTGQQDLVDVICESVAPYSWRQNGGSSSVRMFGDKLVVTTTEPNHREISKLMTLLFAGADGGPGIMPPKTAEEFKALPDAGNGDKVKEPTLRLPRPSR